MTLITAQMQHTEETIFLLSKTQYAIFHFGRQVLQLVLGLLLMVLGITYYSDFFLSALFLLAGCVMLTGSNVVPRYRAKRVIEAFNNCYPSSKYEFRDDCFLLDHGPEQTIIPYDKLIRLVHDSRFSYLYISKESAYMMDKSTLSVDLDFFLRYVSDRSGLQWTAPNNLLTYGLRSAVRNRKASVKITPAGKNN